MVGARRGGRTRRRHGAREHVSRVRNDERERFPDALRWAGCLEQRADLPGELVGIGRGLATRAIELDAVFPHLRKIFRGDFDLKRYLDAICF